MNRILPAALAATLLFGAPASAGDLTAMTDEERAAFRDEVRAYLLENPEVILEAMDVLRAREEQAAEAADKRLLEKYGEQIFNDGISWVGGNPEGDVTIVEFLDYRCGYCRRAHPEVKALLEKDGNIRWVVKEFPILGPDSEMSSRMAIATLRKLGPEAYGRLHDVLMTFEGPVNDQTLPLIAKRAEIDLAAIRAEMDSEAVTDHIGRMHGLARALKINGTPSFVIGDTFVRGYVPEENMAAIVADVRKRRE